MTDKEKKDSKAPVKGKADDQDLLSKYEEIWDLSLSKAQLSYLERVIPALVKKCEDDNQDFRKDIYKWDDQYEGILPPKVFPWENCANYHAPITELNVNSIYSRVIKRFRNMDYLRVKTYRENKDSSLLTQKYLRFLFEKKMAYTDLLMSTARDVLKFGSGVYIVTWQYEEKKKKVVVPKPIQIEIAKDPITGEAIMDDGIEYVIEEQTTFHQQPKIEWVDLCDYFRSTESNRFVEPTWEARRIWMSAVEFYHRSKKQEYDSDNVSTILEEALSKLPSEQQSIDKLDEREVIEWWGWIRLDEKDPMSEPERIVFTYDKGKNKCLKVMRFPYFFDNSNFTVVNMERRSTTWKGRGMCQKLQHVNEEMDKLHDIYLDSAAIVTCKSFKRRRGADTNFLLEQFSPGVVWDVGRMDDIEVMNLGDNPVAPLKELEMLERLAAKQTGIGSYQTGQDFGGVSQPTASGQLAVIQEGNITLDEIAKEFTFGTIRMAKQVLQMVHQFRPEDEFLEVMSQEDADIIEKIEVDVAKLIDDPELIICDRSVIEEQDFKNQSVEIYNMVRTDPILSQIPRIYMSAIQNLVTAYKTIDADLLVPTEEELIQAQNKAAEMQNLADMQRESQRAQLQMQLAQIQAQVKQQQIAAQQQQAQAQQQFQAGEAEKNRQLELEKQAREQEAGMAKDALSQEQALPPGMAGM